MSANLLSPGGRGRKCFFYPTILKYIFSHFFLTFSNQVFAVNSFSYLKNGRRFDSRHPTKIPKPTKGLNASIHGRFHLFCQYKKIPFLRIYVHSHIHVWSKYYFLPNSLSWSLFQWKFDYFLVGVSYLEFENSNNHYNNQWIKGNGVIGSIGIDQR